MHVKFDYEIKVNDFKHTFRFVWLLGSALFAVRFRSYWELWHKHVATNEHVINIL